MKLEQLKGLQGLQDYLEASEVTLLERDFDVFECSQKSDNKSLSFLKRDVENITARSHVKNEGVFYQIDFESRPSILVLKDYIGFRPLSRALVEKKILPEVVTTVDLEHVKKSLENLLCNDDSNLQEFVFLRLTFLAIAEGAEAVGFDMSDEKNWVMALSYNHEVNQPA